MDASSDSRRFAEYLDVCAINESWAKTLWRSRDRTRARRRALDQKELARGPPRQTKLQR